MKLNFTDRVSDHFKNIPGAVNKQPNCTVVPQSLKEIFLRAKLICKIQQKIFKTKNKLNCPHDS